MDDEKQDDSEVLETTEKVVTEDAEHSGEDAETVESLTEKNKKLFARAKKAEGFELKDGKWEKIPKAKQKEETAPSQQNGLSAKDFLALTEAKVSSEDFDEIEEYASYKKLSISEALKDKTLKNILQDKADERRTANATQTKSGRGASKVSGEDLLARAEKGEEIKLDDESAQALFQARLARKLPKKR